MRPLRPSALLLALCLGACGGEGAAPLVGTWQDDRWADSADVFDRRYTFGGDGTLTIRMRRPPASDTLFYATYALERDSFLTLSDERGSEQFIARVQRDTLVLRSPERTTTFVRVVE